MSQQMVSFNGAINDSAERPIQDVNLILLDTEGINPPTYGITDNAGNFNLTVFGNSEYKISISHLGFNTIKGTLTIGNKDLIRDFIMTRATNELKEVIVTYSPPISQKRDTTIYDVEHFSNGKERKLKELLKKLPGIEVSRKGEILFKGNKVSKVLVEDKVFFNGRSKMAVDNIPAKVISKVEMIENYNKTSLLKGLENSDELVINLTLKDEVKNILFGTSKNYLGYKDRYEINPVGFLYTPKSTLNVIGDFNNIQSKSFTLQDYISLEADKSIENVSNLLNSKFVKFLEGDEYFQNTHLLSGLNYQWNPNKKNELRIFTIGLRDISKTEVSNNRIYQASQFQEERTSNSDNENNIQIARLDYNSIPNKDTELRLKLAYERTNLLANSVLSSSLLNTTNYTTKNKALTQTFTSHISFIKRISKKITTSLNLKFKYLHEEIEDNWNSDTNFFTLDLPVRDDSSFNIFGLGDEITRDFQLNVVSYFRPKRTDLITFGFKGNFFFGELNNSAFQKFSDGNRLIFDDFQNNFSSSQNFLKTSISYKKLIGPLIVDLGLNVSNNFWNDSTSEIFKATNLLFQGNLEMNLLENKSLILVYNRRIQPSSYSLRIPNKKLLDFNSVLVGNPNLSQASNDRVSLSLNSFNSYGWSYYLNIGYRKQRANVLLSSFFSNQNGILSYIQPSLPTEGYDTLFRLKYNTRYWFLRITNNYYSNKTFTELNGSISPFLSKVYEAGAALTTNYESAPNFDIELKNTLFQRENNSFSNTTNFFEIDFTASYDFSDWKLSVGYLQSLFNNDQGTARNNFVLLNSAVFYNAENSNWEFGMEINNLLNSSVKISNDFNPEIFYETRTRAFPRTILFGASYQF